MGRKYGMGRVGWNDANQQLFETESRGNQFQNSLSFLGVKPILSSTPSWKVPILQGKNKQVIDAFLVSKEQS